MDKEYLKVFTFLTKEEIENIMKEQKECPEKRVAQKTLAFEVVKDLHGLEEAEKAKQTSEDIFSGKVHKDMPTKKVSESSMNILDLLVETELAPSKSEARRLVLQGGIKVNGEKVENADEIIEINDTVINKGKKVIIKVEKM